MSYECCSDDDSYYKSDPYDISEGYIKYLHAKMVELYGYKNVKTLLKDNQKSINELKKLKQEIKTLQIEVNKLKTKIKKKKQLKVHRNKVNDIRKTKSNL